MRKIYLSIIAFAMLSVVATAQELVVNGDFETWTQADLPDNWTNETGTNLTQETTTIHGGSSAMHVELTTGSQGDTDFRQTISVIGGTTYNVSVWVYQLDADSKARLYVDGYQGYSDNTVLNQWQEVTYTYIPAATGDVEVGLRYYDQNGFPNGVSNLIVDDFSVMVNVTAPVISNIAQTPAAPTVADAVDVSADITDDGTVASATLTWSNDGGTTTNDINMSVVSGNSYSTDTQIPAQAAGTTVTYFITAVDDNSETTVSSEYSYYIGDFCNGDFEAWTAAAPDCWSTIDAGVTITEENTTVHGGSASMHVDVTDAAQANTDIRQYFNAVAGETYDVSVWVYQLDTLSQARLYFKDWQGFSDKLLVNQWQEITYQYTATTTEAFEVGLRFYDAAGFVDHSNMYIDDFFIQIVTGVNSVNNSSLNIYPNPVNDILTVKGQNISSVEIIDINGKTQRLINNVKTTQNIDVADLKQGIYFVKITNEKGTKVSKLVKL